MGCFCTWHFLSLTIIYLVRVVMLRWRIVSLQYSSFLSLKCLIDTSRSVLNSVFSAVPSGSGSEEQGPGKKEILQKIDAVTSAIIHTHSRTATTMPPLAFTENGSKVLAVHSWRRIFSARGSVHDVEPDKTCLVHGRHREHGRPWEAWGPVKLFSHFWVKVWRVVFQLVF